MMVISFFASPCKVFALFVSSKRQLWTQFTLHATVQRSGWKPEQFEERLLAFKHGRTIIAETK